MNTFEVILFVTLALVFLGVFLHLAMLVIGLLCFIAMLAFLIMLAVTVPVVGVPLLIVMSIAFVIGMFAD